MMRPSSKYRSGFSLVELAIVLGVMGAIIGAIWQVTGTARQNAHVQQAQDQLNALVEATRVAYAPQVNILGNVSTVIPYLNQTGSLTSAIIRPVTSACSGVTSNYADTPWPVTYDACGSLRVCAWTYGTTTGCSAASAGAQFFAVEFQQLTYASCVALVQSVSPNLPPGLKDVSINTFSVDTIAAAASLSPALPVPPAIAQNRAPFTGEGCLTATTNTVDFIYTLRPPAN